MSGLTTESAPAAATPLDPLVLVRGMGGAIAGGIAGYFLFWILFKNGMVGYMIPGALLGLGAGLAARGQSIILGVICAVLAIGLTLFTAWHVAFQQFTLVEFLSRLHQIPVRLLIMALGVAMAFWFGRGR